MPGRQSHGAPAPKKASARANSKKRSLDAFSIASHQNPDRIKVRQNRLGASEGGNRPNKRRRNAEEDGDEDEEEDEQVSAKKRKGPIKGRFDELDVDEGSDSEGNEWKMGHVGSEDDSDIDSDEAFGESDEEKFDGYAFSGSTENKKPKNQTPRAKDMTLDENDIDELSNSDESSDDLGDDAIDLAAMLDATEGDEHDTAETLTEEHEGSLSGFEDESDDDEDEEEYSDDSGNDSSSSSIDDTTNPAKLATVQEMVKGLSQRDRSNQGPRNHNSTGSGEKLTIDDFAATSSTTTTKKPKKERKHQQLGIPLAKRQQDRLDRSAAYEKAKEELGRWTDTVKLNRRADHLMFPLPDNDIQSAKNNTKLQPTSIGKPFNELEATIQSILEESGLATSTGKYDEDRIREFEDLESNKMSIEEVKARRDQLRMARELLFREEVKAKRIKKIKSKSYRKVHRKQREKEERMNNEALAEGGFEPSEDELEAQDRRRATERMGQKHRESKWAKATKATGRAAWDDDARAGITEMARRDEELRKRVEGRVIRKAYGNDTSSSSETDDSGGDDNVVDDKRLLKKLQSINHYDQIDDTAPGSKLANMKFMLKAEATRKQENDAMVEEMRRELAGEAPVSVEDVDIGRRIFGPGSHDLTKTPPKTKHDFEEPDNSEAEDRQSEDKDKSSQRLRVPSQKKSGNTSGNSEYTKVQATRNESTEGGAWSKAISKSDSINDAESKRRRHKANNAVEVEELDFSQAAMIATRPKTTKSAKKSTVLNESSEEESGDENAVRLPFVIRDQELIQRAFAGADVVGEFEAEKKQTIMDEDEKVVDNTLPGWGSWTGDGLSKREKARNKGRVLTKVAGIKEGSRKDAKLDRVIINEKRVKKVSDDHPCSMFLTNFLLRIQSTLPPPYLIHLSPNSSMRDRFGCRSDRNGPRKNLCRTTQSHASYLSRGLSHQCLNHRSSILSSKFTAMFWTQRSFKTGHAWIPSSF